MVCFQQHSYFCFLYLNRKKFDDIFPKLAKEFDLNFIPFLLKKVALNPKLNQSDGIHANYKGVKMILIACNTVSASAKEDIIRKAGSIPVLDVISAVFFFILV